ncbi:hypothetical protein FNF27_03162 [Cafeteria roenbergensis]|uniref:Uncharacterized protein n=1 Tax=Cafeteria roenbergensis TaxID=33653 RepID=A0A5A8E0Y5_CAFRO|nr:hypothetical protein FNF29_06841 [Cafeteria roenbergensis]KAA0162301.1 hypothetical protein FNF31_03343 [Cafeteria roenbergensis]KAA0169740.1 hypothetical protein FNF28_01859 [Cafeteria roenbergensis]KAA0175462.1 hypothetical protein FNF27_03162 [Cafeteria roenbergensis]|eukprot:KAA0148182.1 hypothetical protein FNF29_06841 [Cafeteria roenbergensis]
MAGHLPSKDVLGQASPAAAALVVVGHAGREGLLSPEETRKARWLAIEGSVAIQAAAEVFLLDGDVAGCADTVRRVLALAERSEAQSHRF